MLLKGRIETLQSGIASARETAHNESKSSAGDKYETTRAMMHLEIDKLGISLAEANRLFILNEQASIANGAKKVGLGSLVSLNNQWYFFGAGLGKIIVNDKTVFAVSIDAPIAKVLNGKVEGDRIEWNGKTHRIDCLI